MGKGNQHYEQVNVYDRDGNPCICNIKTNEDGSPVTVDRRPKIYLGYLVAFLPPISSLIMAFNGINLKDIIPNVKISIPAASFTVFAINFIYHMWNNLQADQVETGRDEFDRAALAAYLAGKKEVHL